MFNFVCKSLLLYYGRRRYTVTGSSCYNKAIAFPLFIKCMSRFSTTSNQHSFTVSYLINSCGFSPQSALSASKRVHFDSPENPDSVIDLFRSHGFSETQISQVIRAHPQILCSSPEETLLPKIEFFYSKGFSSQELAKVMCVCPNLLLRSLETHLVPTLNYLSNLFQSSGMIVAAIKCSPFLFQHDVETCIAPSVDVMREIGVPERNIVLFLRTRSRFFRTSVDSFKETTQAVKEMGIDPASYQFILAVSAKEIGRTHWESKVDVYRRRWGWSEEEFLAAFRKYPRCMTVSKEKIMKSMDFLVNRMKLESSAIARRPDIIKLSMEKRFIPRAAGFECLLSKGLVERKNSSLLALFTLPEKAFLRRFVSSFDGEAPELSKIYQDKLGISEVTKTSAVSREGVALSL